jgi:predicted  nucleic acid-binding Zn-ribbon protein
MTEITPATTRPVDHRAKLKTEITRLERKIKDKELDIELLQDQIEDLQIEIQESED